MSDIPSTFYKVQPEDTKSLRIAVLISGEGSNLQALIDAIENKQLQDVKIELVISNKANAYGLQRALKHRLPTIFIPWKQRELAEERTATLLQLFEIDLIVLAGWMRIFSADFIEHFPRRIINLHPALLSDDGTDTYTTSDGSVIPVIRGLHVVQKALDAGLKVTGSSAHYVIPAVDAGPPICRVEVPIQPGDTEEILQERIKQQEHNLIIEAVKKFHAENNATPFPVNY